MQAANTTRGYAHSWKIFSRWCGESGRRPVPASPETLKLFLVWALYEQKYKPANVDHIFGAVKDRHRQLGFDPKEGFDHTVRDARLAAKRDLAEKGLQRPRPMRAITIEQLEACVALFQRDGSITAIRDQAILLTTFACSWRRSEMVKLDLADVEFTPEGMIVTQHHGKTDQMGRLFSVGIPYATKRPNLCAVTALKRWLAERGDWPGPLFTQVRKKKGTAGRVTRTRLWDGHVRRVVKGALEGAGIPSNDYAAHSLRAGMITAAADAGADVVTIQQRTGHRRIETVLKYIRAARALRADPLAKVL